MNKEIWKYFQVVSSRIYRPIKPVINPLLKRIKFVQVLVVMLIINLVGILYPSSSVYQSQQRAGQWPWSTKSHSQIALSWLENGNEAEAIRELEIANKLLIINTQSEQDSLKRAEDKVREPERIREEILLWESVLEEKPYYRDILLRLSLLHHRLYQNEKALNYWENANYLDPNNKQVQQVGEIINLN